MNKRRIVTIIMMLLIISGVIASQLGSAAASCLRNCPSEGTGTVVVTQELE